MILRIDCRKQLQHVRQAAEDPAAAYVARTRLGRLILSCTRLIAQEFDMPKPALPAPMTTPKGASPLVKDLTEVCNQLESASRRACQPSEPLSARWEEEWQGIQGYLDRLDLLLQNEKALSS